MTRSYIARFRGRKHWVYAQSNDREEKVNAVHVGHTGCPAGERERRRETRTAREKRRLPAYRSPTRPGINHVNSAGFVSLDESSSLCEHLSTPFSSLSQVLSEWIENMDRLFVALLVLAASGISSDWTIILSHDVTSVIFQ